MPRYDYVCNDCTILSEQTHGPHENPKPCSACGSTSLTKKVHPPALAFKGSGFHVTDYPRAGQVGGS